MAELINNVKKILKKNRLVRRFYKTFKDKAQQKIELKDYIKSHQIKNKNGIVAVCHPEYRGIKSATYKMFDNIYEISEFHSLSVAKCVAKEILETSPKLVVLNGYPFGYDLLAREINKLDPKVKIYTYCHGPFIWFDFYPDENVVLNNYLKLNKEGIVKKMAFCKKDLVEYFGSLGYNTTYVMNRFELSATNIHKRNESIIKIGVFGSGLWHRNILNQVVGALMVPNAEVHVNELKEIPFIDNSRVVRHGILQQEEYLKLFSQMDIALYVSFTDAFPMTLIESMSMGVPAIASDTSDVYSFDQELKNMLVLSAIDSPVAIRDKVLSVLSNYEEVQTKLIKYAPILKVEVEKSIENFLNIND
jgi:glycosyltransferase involved in cell wall biosynthesis